MIDSERLRSLRSSLAADGYQMEVTEQDGRIDVLISATQEACAGCLVPKDLMRGILGQVIGVAEDEIDLTYPRELGAPPPTVEGGGPYRGSAPGAAAGATAAAPAHAGTAAPARAGQAGATAEAGSR
jgi:hypothetical protein